MMPSQMPAWLESLRKQPHSWRKRLIYELTPHLTPEQRQALAYDWSVMGRDDQQPPPGDWPYWLIRAGRGYGKALALDTPLPTPTGWTTMGDVQPGDELFDENGNICRVTFTTEVQHNRTCYDVVFSDESVITSDAEHRWLTWDKPARKAHGRAQNPTIHQQVRTTEEIRATLMNGKEVNHSVQTAMALGLPEADLPLDPYIFGAWLGDGSSACAEITTADPEMLEYIEQAGYVLGAPRRAGGKAITVGFTKLSTASRRGYNGQFVPVDGNPSTELRRLGVIKNKHIPTLYARASASQRMALLKGLMDTDGSCRDGHVEIVSIKERLANDIIELVCSLGFKPTMSIDRAKLNGVDCGPRYRIKWTPHEPVFRLTRKLVRQHTGKAQAERNRRRYIVEVRPRDSVPVRCIQVDSPSSLFLAGRTMIPTHNTRTGAEWVRMVAEANPRARIALVGPTAADVRDVMIEGESGVMGVAPPWARPVYEPSKRRLTWPNGALATAYSADQPDRLRGPQHTHAWTDELAAWRYPDAWDMLMMGLRLGDVPQCVITTTPKPVKLMKQVQSLPGIIITRGRTVDNASNLAAGFLTALMGRYEGTRLGRQELDGEELEDNPDALWTREALDEQRIREVPELVRLVVAIDPAVTSGEDSDETGIVVAGLGHDKRGYVLADLSGRYKPNQWARIAIEAYREWGADRIVAESNQGGDMVAHTLRTVDQGVPVKLVHASRGKVARAEPVAALYEQRKVSHVGVHARLEDQLCTWSMGQASPDRLDALVWALTELMLSRSEVAFG